MTKNSQTNGARRFFSSATFKFMLIGIITLLLLIPTGSIRNLINERENLRDITIEEVSNKWGHSQTICAPILTIPFKVHYLNEKNKPRWRKEYAHFLPENLSVEGEILPEIRHRSIYKVIVYESELDCKANFQKPDFSEWNVNEEDILWKETKISIGISDFRGIKNSILVQTENNSFKTSKGLNKNDLFTSGVFSKVGEHAEGNFNIQFKLDIRGSKELNFVPLGAETKIHISSPWNTPSFDGYCLPEHEISDTGFVADWTVLEANRNYPQKWLGRDFSVNHTAFGVKLLFAVDPYQKAERAVKYAFLFILLTFMVFFFIEVKHKKSVHIIQYVLIGVSLTVFFSLLLSLSEHIKFNLSYLIAGISNIVLITLFAGSVFKKKISTFATTLILCILYIFLFTVLQLSDFALLIGNIGLFVAVALMLYFSMKIDWNATIRIKEKR